MTALFHGAVANPVALWDRFATSICDDLPNVLARRDDLPASPHPDLHLDYGLFLLAGLLADHGRSLADYGLPIFQCPWARADDNPLLSAELRYVPAEELRSHDDIYAQLNPDQHSCFDTIVTAIDSDPRNAHFFI